MVQIPYIVQKRLEELQKQSEKNLDIKVIKGYFFVYETKSKWDKARKKVVTISRYVGRIMGNGDFKPTRPKPRLSPEDKIFELQGQIKNLEQQLEIRQKEEAGREDNRYEKIILTALSMNGRMPYSMLGKMLGIKETATYAQVKKIERRYDIKYTPEMDVEKLGYLEFIITVKFVDKFPPIKELKAVLSKEALVQLALLTKGEFDLVLYALAKDNEEINDTIARIRTTLLHKSIWNVSPIYVAYGFIPLRTEFFDLLKSKLLDREYAILRELSINGKIEFTEIDEKYNFDKGRSQYTFHKIKEGGILKRISISMHKLPIKYIGIIVKSVIDYAEFRKNREHSISDIIQDRHDIINKYLFVADTLSPDGTILYLPTSNYNELDEEIERLANFKLGIKLTSAVITNILLGNFCYRRFDNTYSIQQEILEKEYRVMKVERVNYEETGKKKIGTKYSEDIRGTEQSN